MNFDIVVIGSGPGGFAAATRAAKLGKKVAVVENDTLGGTCVNWGCIPTKALLKSASVVNTIKHSADYGVVMEGSAVVDFGKVIARSRNVAQMMSKGVAFVLDKADIAVFQGTARLNGPHTVEVTDKDNNTTTISSENIILAMGARPRELPNLPIDGKKIISSRQALNLEKLPTSMLVVGSGAIGMELAMFYAAMGTQITIVEMMPSLMPLEDEDVSKQIERSLRKARIAAYTSSKVLSVDTSAELCCSTIETPKGEITIESEVVLSAVGIKSNIDNCGLEEAGVVVVKDKVMVDDHFMTTAEGIYAIGDIVRGPALAHVASSEGILCAEAICGIENSHIDYANIPSCVFTTPEVASVGLTQKQAEEAGFNVKTSSYSFMGSGKAMAVGERDGFAKLIFDADNDTLLGAHLVGHNVTEMIAEPTIARALGAKAKDLAYTIHPHPTMSEGVMSAAFDYIEKR